MFTNTLFLEVVNFQIIILIGCPASGKSFFFEEYLEPEGYIHVNRDTLRTWQKCVKITEQSIKDQLSVVVDNTNTDKETRARYMSIAKEHNVPVRAFYMTTTLDHAKHNNTVRTAFSFRRKFTFLILEDNNF